MVYTILVIVQVIVALTLIGLVLVQHGKGADAGAAFGSGASGTVFGAKGSANFLSRATAALATLFFAVSLTLAYLVNGASSGTVGGGSVTDQLSQQKPAPTQLSDKNGNGVPGDEVLTGDKPGGGKDDGDAAGAAGGAASKQSNGAAPAAGNDANHSAGSTGGGGTGAKIPD